MLIYIQINRDNLLMQTVREIVHTSDKGGVCVCVWWLARVGYRLDLYDTGAKTILLKRYRFLNGA